MVDDNIIEMILQCCQNPGAENCTKHLTDVIRA